MQYVSVLVMLCLYQLALPIRYYLYSAFVRPKTFFWPRCQASRSYFAVFTLFDCRSSTNECSAKSFLVFYYFLNECILLSFKVLNLHSCIKVAEDFVAPEVQLDLSSYMFFGYHGNPSCRPSSCFFQLLLSPKLISLRLVRSCSYINV